MGRCAAVYALFAGEMLHGSHGRLQPRPRRDRRLTQGRTVIGDTGGHVTRTARWVRRRAILSALTDGFEDCGGANTGLILTRPAVAAY